MKPAGWGFSPADGRARADARRTEAQRTAAEPDHPRGRYPPRRRAGLMVSGTDGRPFGQATGPRLKRASGSLNGIQRIRLNRSVGAGFEPATKCLSGICSTHLSYPHLRDRPESNRCLAGTSPLPCHLATITFFIRRNTDTQRAPRRSGPTARTRGRAKERAYAPTGFRIQDGICTAGLQRCIFAMCCGTAATARCYLQQRPTVRNSTPVAPAKAGVQGLGVRLP